MSTGRTAHRTSRPRATTPHGGPPRPARAAAGYSRFLCELSADTGWPTETAERFASGVIVTLQERIVGEECAIVPRPPASQVRRRLQASSELTVDVARTTMPDEFLGRVSRRIGEPVEQVGAIVGKVVRALLCTHFRRGEAHHVESALPDELTRLWSKRR